MDAAELRRRAEAITWFHSMDLGQGVRTTGEYRPQRTLSRIGLADDLAGRTVLDVGAWDGFYSFEAERRGAARVVAADSYSWGGGGWGTKAGFDLAHEALGSQVEARQVDLFDLDPADIGTFDIVLLLGVLYHLRDPVGALERVAAVTAGTLILETEVDMLLTRRPAAAFFPDRELNDDPTNWWAPNVAATLGMLRTVGFAHAEVVWRRPLPLRAARWGLALARGRRSSLWRELQSSRFVFHARR